MSSGVLYLGNEVSDMLTSIDETLPGMTESIFDDWFVKNAGILADKFLCNEGEYCEVEDCLCFLENSLKVTYEDIDCNRRWWLMRDSSGDFISLQIERD